MARAQIGSVLVDRVVLLIEDEYFLADEIHRALSKAGARIVGPFAEVAEGLRAAESRDLSCAVLDINLRDTPVYPVAETLRRRGIPFVFTTGYDEAAIPAAYQSVPRHEKPLDVAELIQALVAIVER